jgi:lysozyme family protein
LQRWYGADYVVTNNDVKEMSEDLARKIYQKFYWDANLLDQVTDPKVSGLLFDQIVNRGARSVAEQAQRILLKMNFKVVVDGVFGPDTIKIINQVNYRIFAINFFKESQSFYVKLCQKSPDQMVFLGGWINRTHQLLDEILKGAI